jgi:methylated-DNA-[protein]-cysteine S-methyltransferase
VFDLVIDFPKMKVGVATREGRVVEIRYLPATTPTKSSGDPFLAGVARQLERYRADPDTRFDFPVVIEGTPLQRAVWDAMRAIPRGRTRTYGDIARELGADAREIGQACGDNRLPIVIPCHRVVAAKGLGGFAHATSGYLIEVKRWLLAHEAPAFELRP